jgi:hypothetical protein
VFIAPYDLGLCNKLRFVLKALIVFGANFWLVLSCIPSGGCKKPHSWWWWGLGVADLNRGIKKGEKEQLL